MPAVGFNIAFPVMVAFPILISIIILFIFIIPQIKSRTKALQLLKEQGFVSVKDNPYCIDKFKNVVINLFFDGAIEAPSISDSRSSKSVKIKKDTLNISSKITKGTNAYIGVYPGEKSPRPEISQRFLLYSNIMYSSMSTEGCYFSTCRESTCLQYNDVNKLTGGNVSLLCFPCDDICNTNITILAKNSAKPNFLFKLPRLNFNKHSSTPQGLNQKFLDSFYVIEDNLDITINLNEDIQNLLSQYSSAFDLSTRMILSPYCIYISFFLFPSIENFKKLIDLGFTLQNNN